MLILLTNTPGGWRPLRVLDEANLDLVLEHLDAGHYAIARCEIAVEIEIGDDGLDAERAAAATELVVT